MKLNAYNAALFGIYHRLSIYVCGRRSELVSFHVILLWTTNCIMMSIVDNYSHARTVVTTVTVC